MTLNDSQKEVVAEWIGSGMKLAEIQERLETEFHVTMTYMEVRFLVDDLQLTPRDPEPEKMPDPTLGAEDRSLPDHSPDEEEATELTPEEALTGGRVSVTVDQLARPGALVSGSVTFSDAQSATWQLDQLGRLGIATKQPGYKPTPTDLQAFQARLQNELARLGF